VNVQFKKPINRKLIYSVVFGLVAIGVLGMIVVSLEDPRAKRQINVAEKEREEVERLPTGEEEAARLQLEHEIERLRKEAAARDAAQNEQQPFEDFMGNQSPPAYDPNMLRLLDEAQQEVARSPEIAREVTSTVSRRSGRGGGESAGLIYDNYGKRDPSSSDDNDDLFAEDNSRPDPGVYETLRPSSPPAERIVSQGSSIHAVLMSNIDTRNDGDIIAMVTRDVYDSKTMRMRLIPQGSRLVGEYSTSVTPGADRIEVNFNRLIMPDGRAFDLPSIRAGGGDGTSGVKGKYRSNLLQAIGPSFVVAFLGQVIDRRTKKDIPVNEGAIAVGPGGLQQSPSILEQITPQINQEILQRYQGARPYFLIKPGQHMRIQTTEDIEVPISSSSVSGGVR